ncbi:MAG: agmatine deiminase family protein, partial [Bacillota bacterium]
MFKDKNSMSQRAIRFITIIVIVSACMLIALAVVTLNNLPFKYTGERKYLESKPITYSFPAEFEKQQAIWMLWPSGIYNADTRPVNPVMVNILKSLAPYIRVNLVAQNTGEIEHIKKLLLATGLTGGANVYYYIVDHMSIWARDV